MPSVRVEPPLGNRYLSGLMQLDRFPRQSRSFSLFLPLTLDLNRDEIESIFALDQGTQ